MPTMTVQACRRPDGGRQGRNGAFIEVFGPQDYKVAEYSPGPTLAAPTAFGPYRFAFWSIVGAAGGNYATLANPAPYTVGTTNIVARAWYVVSGAKPQPGFPSGVYVDAFDIDAGVFFDEPFVAVKNADLIVNLALWLEANISGFVPTVEVKYAEASALVDTHGFERWESVDGATEPSGGTLLTAGGDSNAQAVAFYRHALVLKPRQARHLPGADTRSPLAGTWVSWGARVDGGGPTGGGPIGPWGAHVMEIAAGVALADAAERLDRTLRRDALKAAARQVSLVSERLQQALETDAKAAKK